MAQTIKLKRSATAGNTPTTSQLALGELGINTTDGKLFLKKSVSGTESIVDVGGLPLTGGTLTGNLSLGDNVKAQFGAGSDLQIYHDGSDSFVKDTGTGDLYLQGSSNIFFRKGNGNEVFAHFADDGACKLRFDNSTKIATTATGIDVTGTVVTDGVTVDGTLKINEVIEKAVPINSTTGTINFYFLEQSIINFLQDQTANRTINFGGDGSTSLNSMLSNNESVTCSILMPQGATPYYLNAYQVDGSSVTPKWSGGSAPTAGNASGIDVYSFTIIKTASATFTVLGSQTQYA